jgi:hypothetical protein
MWIECKRPTDGQILFLVFRLETELPESSYFVRVQWVKDAQWDVQSLDEDNQLPQDRANAALDEAVAELVRRGISGTTLAAVKSLSPWWSEWKKTRSDLSWDGDTVLVVA